MFKKYLVKAINNPRRAITFIKGKFYSFFVKKYFSSSKQNRSDSDDGLYVRSINSFLISQKKFNNFKNDPFYQSILEHASKKDGKKYLDIVLNQSPEIIESNLELFLQNDEIGNPVTYSYESYGKISPSTLRYIKVASDIKTLFGESIGRKIVEIGGGYGGQALILDSLFNFQSIKIFDLHIVCNLITKYLEHFTLRNSYSVSSLNEASQEEYDLAISNYAFSELPRNIQLKYIEKVLQNSKRGYLTMNSGRTGDHAEKGKINPNRLRLNELEKLLPDFEVFDEVPLTSEHNYLIVWGHNNSL